MTRPFIELYISGHVCSKKNQLKLTRGGHGYYDAETKANIKGITDQLAAQWRADSVGPRPPLTHPSLACVFYVTTTNSDRDNKWTTIQDCLVDAGVLKGDSIADLNAEILIGRAIKTTGVAGARIWIEEAGNSQRLFRHVAKQDLEDYQVILAQREVTQNTRFKRA